MGQMARPPPPHERAPNAKAVAKKRRRPLGKGHVYFEKQVLKQCVKHAVNNALGGPILTADHLDALARARALRLAPPGAPPAPTYDAYDGMYSFGVVHDALRKKGCDVRAFTGIDFQRLPNLRAGQFVVCVNYGVPDATAPPLRTDGPRPPAVMSHAFAVDCDRQLLLDSQLDAPVPLTPTAFAALTTPNAEFPLTRITRVYQITRSAHIAAATATGRPRRRHRRRSSTSLPSFIATIKDAQRPVCPAPWPTDCEYTHAS